MDGFMNKKEQRNYGIDLLRIVSMIMIATLHVCGQGGLLSINTSFPKKLVIDFFESASFCSVNCYGMISGYVGYGKKTKLSSLIQLWIEVVFYLVIINVVCSLAFDGSVSLSALKTSFIPVSSNAYWYFTSFFALFFFKPFLNYFMETMNKRRATELIVICFCILSVFPVLIGGNHYGGDIFKTSGGYSALWLGILYIIGAFIKKYKSELKLKKRYCLMLFFSCIFSILLLNRLIDFASAHIALIEKYNFFVKDFLNLSYCSPLIVLSGLALFLLFSDLRLNSLLKKITAFFAPAAFGVYLIHVHPKIWELLENRFTFAADYNIIILPFFIVAVAVSIWLVCSLIDKIRIELFVLLRFKKISSSIEKRIKSLFDRIIFRLS